LIRTRILLAACALALTVAAVLAACGDDDSDAASEDPQTVLEQTFENENTIASGNLDLSLSGSAEGEQGGSFEASLSGPFQGDPDDPTTIPELDVSASVSGEGAGQSVDFDGGVTITADNAYVEIRDQAYEIGEAQFAQIKDGLEAQTDTAESAEESSASFEELCTQALGQVGGDASACEIDFSTWLTNLTNEGTEEVGGAETVHVSGDANTEQILTDIGELAGMIPGASSQSFDPAQLGTFSDVVTEASIDVYSGTDDSLLRRLDASLTLDPSKLGIPVGIGIIEASLSFEIADLNEDQTIEAPADARPIQELGGGFDLGGLGGVGGLGLPGGGGGGGGATGLPDAEAQQCIEEAQTIDELNQCLK
jgi:hypothetical protein